MTSFRVTLAKFAVFTLVTVLLSGYIAIVVGDITFTKTDSYSAQFVNASSLQSGAPVRIAGVEVGKVDGISVQNGGQGPEPIKVAFHVASGIALPRDVRATIRFKNLVGDQYLELDEGTDAATLPVGSTIPVSNTKSALDLDTLFNGFQPLFAGLDTSEINNLSTAIVNVLQGESGAVYQLIDSVSSLFATLADNDQLISSVITNLDTALGSVAANSHDLSDLISQLEQLVSGLAADRAPIGNAVVHINTLASSAAAFLSKVRAPLKVDVPALDALATALNKQTDTLQFVLSNLPAAYKGLIRTGSYASVFNFYLCGLRFKLTGPNGPIYTPFTYSNLARCQPK